MKLSNDKIKEFIKIDASYNGEFGEHEFKATISLWHLIWISAIIAICIYKFHH